MSIVCLGKMLPREGRFPAWESQECNLAQRKEVAEGVGFENTPTAKKTRLLRAKQCFQLLIYFFLQGNGRFLNPCL